VPSRCPAALLVACGFAGLAQLDLKVVQRVLAVSLWPPQVGVRHVDVQGCLGRGWPHHVAHLPTRDPREKLQARGCSRTLQVDRDADPSVTAGNGDGRADPGEPGGAPRFQGDRPPDARGDQRGTPVPTEVAGHLADEVDRVRGRGGGNGQVPHPVPLPLGVVQGGAEIDRQPVVAGPQQPGDLEPVGAVHVRRAGHLRAVDLDGGDGVQPVADQVDAVGGFPGEGEPGFVAPAGAPDPRQLGLVLVQVGVGDELGGEQVGVHRSWYPRGDLGAGDADRDFGRGLVGDRAEGPAGVQGPSASHRTLPAIVGGGSGRGGSKFSHRHRPCRRRSGRSIDHSQPRVH